MKYLTIEPTSISVDLGKKHQLRATFNEDGFIRHDVDIQWSSKNPEVVSVNSRGLVSANKTGSALIIAQAKGEQTSTIVSVKRSVHDLGEEQDIENPILMEDSIELMPSKKEDTFTSSNSSSKPFLPSILISLFDQSETEIIEHSPHQVKLNTTLSSTDLYQVVQALASEHVELKNVTISQHSKVHSNIDQNNPVISVTISVSLNLNKDK